MIYAPPSELCPPSSAPPALGFRCIPSLQFLHEEVRALLRLTPELSGQTPDFCGPQIQIILAAETKLGGPATWIKLSGGSPSEAWCLACAWGHVGPLGLPGTQGSKKTWDLLCAFITNMFGSIYIHL